MSLAAVMLGLIVAAATTVQARDPFPPPAALKDLTLPKGHLRYVAKSQTMADFIDLDRSSVSSHVLILYKVMDPPYALSHGAVSQLVARLVFDCQAHTSHEMGSQEFDDAGTIVLWEPVSKVAPVRPGTGMALIEAYACEGKPPPGDVVIVGHVQALSAARKMLRGH
jgi:hypothetical protein